MAIKPSATSPPDTALRNMPARPVDSEIVADRAPCSAKCSVVSIDSAAAGDSDVADYVRSLESREPEDTLPEASGDAIAAEFERYLRRRGNE